MDEEVLSSMSGLKGIDVSPTSNNERQFVGDLGDVTFCVSNYIKEVMKVGIFSKIIINCTGICIYIREYLLV